MKTTSLFVLGVLGVIVLVPSISNGQGFDFDFWGFGTVPLLMACAKDGYDPGILPPDVDDFWFMTAHCMTHQGTAGCFDVDPVTTFGTCRCNQRDDTYLDNDLDMCIGRVDAYCTLEHNSFFPDKLCTPNAECTAIPGRGTSVGICKCLYGFEPNDQGLCSEEGFTGEGPKSTPRLTTTTTASPREKLKLPSLDLTPKFVSLNSACASNAVLDLNQTYCDTYSRTAACISDKCQCNMLEDSIYDDTRKMCVSLVGSYCLGRPNLLGYKACTQNADCKMEDGYPFDEGYSFGTCDCIYGFRVTEDRTCVRDDTIPNPSTTSPLVTSPTSEGTSATTPGNKDSGVTGILSVGYTTKALIAILFLVYQLL